jgi:outer membrane protein assembly factor BamB
MLLRNCAWLLIALSCAAPLRVAAQARPQTLVTVGGRIRAEPLIGRDGTLYIASDDGTVRALTPKGVARYVVQTGARTRATPVLDDRGTLYVGTNGAVRFRVHVGGPIIVPLALVPASRERLQPIILVAADGLYGFTTQGLPAFHWVTPTALRAPPVVHPRGFAVLGTTYGTLLAIDFTGRRRWEVNAFGAIESGAAIAPDQAIVVGTTLGSLLRFTPEGGLIGAIALPGAIFATPSIAANGDIYVGTENGALYALNAALDPRWRFATHGPIRASARLTNNDLVLVGSTDDFVYALHRDGEERFRYNLGSDITAPVALGNGTTLYVGTDHGTLYALPFQLAR